MFSCCRANPKHSKKDKHKKCEQNGDGDETTTERNEGETKDKVKLVIPTITVENGKPNDENDDDAAETQTETVTQTATKPQSDAESETVAKTNNGSSSVVGDMPDDDNDAAKPEQQADDEEKKEVADDNESGVNNVSVESVAATSSSTAELAPNASSSNDDNSLAAAVAAVNDDAAHKTKSATTTAHSSSSTSVTSTVDIPMTSQDKQEIIALMSKSITTATASEPSQPSDRNDDAAAASVPPPPRTKSCLSRHNSTHMSIKKKVNISTRAEIIEPEPLPQLQKTSSLAEDDDVFSDSVPPPKRESMCAPYIERDDEHDDVADLVAFSHGLPAWFDDERLNELGCIEPPVTPVGRDELELKRQRLYTDLLRAAHAAVEHSVRFTPFAANAATTAAFVGAGAAEASAYNFESATLRTGACDPDLKPSVADNLEQLVNRLELLVERLERSVSARELEIANRAFDTVLERKRESVELDSEQLPPPPPLPLTPAPAFNTVDTLAAQLGQQTDQLSERIERIETSLQRINERHQSVSSTESSAENKGEESPESVRLIPTVLADYSKAELHVQEPEDIPLPPPPLSMSVLGFQDIISGPLSQYLALSAKIGGDVAKHAEFVKLAFDAQLQYVTLATQIAQPAQNKQMELLKPTSTQISAIQDYREKNRTSAYFNHLSAISESIPALGWVCVSPTPGPHVKEMNDAGQFYTNRVLKEWKEKDAKHVEWARAWIQTLTELQAYIKQYHTTGLVWSGKGAAPAGGVPPPPPPGGLPPPPPPLDLDALKLDSSGDDRSALFAQINQGEAITRNLKKVTDDMQTHKNPTLRTGPAPFKTPAQFGSVAASGPAVAKEPVFTRDGKKWLIEYQKNNAGLIVDNAEMNNVVYMFRCEGSTLTVKGKVNNIVLDSCKKCSLLFDSVVASVEFVNCQSVQMQTLGFVPTVSIDKTDGCQMYLSKDSLGVEIVSSKSSEMNILLPEGNGDYTELAVPEQYKTTISGKTLKTVCVDSLG